MKIYKKIIISVVLIAVLFIFCIGINVVKYKQKDESASSNNVLNVTSVFDLAYDISNSKVLANHSTYIALIKIDSIDGVTNINRKTGNPVSGPYSFGKATVIKNIKGNIPNKNIEFSRMGGEMPYDEWIKGDIDPAKIESVRKEAGLDKVSTKDIKVIYKVEGDIEIEENKTYLVYMNQDLQSNKENEYSIQGFQYGLREILVKDGYNINGVENQKVKNNDTGKWEKLSSVVNLGEIK